MGNEARDPCVWMHTAPEGSCSNTLHGKVILLSVLAAKGFCSIACMVCWIYNIVSLQQFNRLSCHFSVPRAGYVLMEVIAWHPLAPLTRWNIKYHACFHSSGKKQNTSSYAKHETYFFHDNMNVSPLSTQCSKHCCGEQCCQLGNCH